MHNVLRLDLVPVLIVIAFSLGAVALTLLTLALDEDALDLQAVDLLLVLIRLVQVDDGQILFIQWRV